MDWKLVASLAIPLAGLIGQWVWLKIKVGDLLEAQKGLETKQDIMERDMEAVKIVAAKDGERLLAIGANVKEVSTKIDKVFDLLLSQLKHKGE